MLGGGGYVAGPVGLAARTLRLPLVLTEADSHLGVSNRLLAPFAAAGVPGVSDRGPDRSEVARHRPAGATRDRGGRPRGRSRQRSGFLLRVPACWCSVGRSAPGG